MAVLTSRFSDMTTLIRRLPRRTVIAIAAVAVVAVVLLGVFIGGKLGLLPGGGLLGHGRGSHGGAQAALLNPSPTPGLDASHSPSPNPTAGAKGAKGLPTPVWQPSLPPAHDTIVGNPEMKTSDCGAGYQPGSQCLVYYGGIYNLVDKPVGKVVVQVKIDGSIQSFNVQCPSGGCPNGGKKKFWYWLKFNVPQQGVREIDYTAFLEDLNGHVLASTPPYVTYGSLV